MKINILLIVCIFLFIPIVVNATHDITDPRCTNNEKIKLRNIANDVKFITEKYKENNTVYYSIEILGLSDTIYVQDVETKLIYKTNGEKILTITPGKIKSLLLYANPNSVCNTYSIYTKIVSIPYYNKYIEDPLCVNNEEHVLCQENTSIQINEDEFKRIMNQYIKDKNKVTPNQPIEEPVEEEITISDKIINFLLNYYIYILSAIIVLGTSGIIILEVRKRRSIL